MVLGFSFCVGRSVMPGVDIAEVPVASPAACLRFAFRTFLHFF